MRAFLTSSPCLFSEEGRPLPQLNPANGFVDALRAAWPDQACPLLVASNPTCPPMTQGMAADLQTAFEEAGLSAAPFTLLDAATAEQAAELVEQANVIVLAGGHVPTQNAFFHSLGLAALLEGWEGVLIGVSAGTMNCATEVYALPEEEGEALDPAYERFIEGLGLIEQMVIPHYQRIREERVDGLLMIDELAVPDSAGRAFLLLPDGSYLLAEDGIERICGPAWVLRDGVTRPVMRHLCVGDDDEQRSPELTEGNEAPAEV